MKRMLFIFSATVLTVAALVSASIAFPTPAVAGGGRNISGIGYFALPGECTNSQGQGSSYAQLMTGDLVGCLYTFVESAECHPDGLYKETGREIFVEQGGGNNTFRTTYVFKAKYVDCHTQAQEIYGACHHPIIAGSGTGTYEGVGGRLDFTDDVIAGNFPYLGRLRY